jgi:hypothetical protein
MSINMIRTIKYRSKENQPYTKTYNRANVAIPSDALQTDLSESYLAMRLRIMDNDGATITTADLERLVARNMAISFGHEDFAYTPACMVKSCILKRGNGSIIESIPFSNIISQTMFQLTTNKERLAAQSLLTGVALSEKRGAAIMNTIPSINKDYVEIQLPLSDLFEVCKSQNFWLSETGGLEISIEFEDKNTLFKVVPIRSAIENDADFSEMLYPSNVSIENNMSQAYKTSSFTHDDSDIQVADVPRVYEEKLFEPISKETTLIDNVPANQQLQFKAELSAAQLSVRGIQAGRHCKMIFEMPDTKKYVAFENEVIDVLPYAAAGAEIPAVLSYTNAGPSIHDWEAVADHVGYYLSGPGTPVAADLVSFTINIDEITGAYSLAAGFQYDNSKPYKAGDKYIVPAKYLGQPSVAADGTAHPEDCEMVVAADVDAGTTPVFNVSGNATPPQPTPGTPEIKSTLIMKYAWYALSLKFIRLEMVEMAVDSITLDAAFRAGITSNSIVVSDAFVEKLKATGLVYYDGRVNQEATFSLSYQLTYPQAYPVVAGSPAAADMISTKETMYIDADIIRGDLTSGSGMMSMPNTGRGVRLISLTDSGNLGTKILKFTDLGCPASTIGLSFQQVWESAVRSQTSVTADLIVSDYQRMTQVLGGSDSDNTLLAKLAKGLTYKVDRLEVVLQQATKNKKIPMGMSYSTMRVEPITIQDNAYDYERQFNVMEPSCYNTALLMPKRGSLVSTLPNVFSYRYQVNNIANTSTDIEVKTLSSDYSSSLHLDKSLDYFSNSTLPLRNFYGIKGLEYTAEPVRVLPLKIYTANDQSNFFTNNRPFSVQLALHSPQQGLRPIEEGTMYFVKSVIMSL